MKAEDQTRALGYAIGPDVVERAHRGQSIPITGDDKRQIRMHGGPRGADRAEARTLHR